jgi:hypothetical protein
MCQSPHPGLGQAKNENIYHTVTPGLGPQGPLQDQMNCGERFVMTAQGTCD